MSLKALGRSTHSLCAFLFPVLQHQKVCSSPEASGSKRKQDKEEKAEEKR